MSLCFINFLQILKIYLIMVSSKHSISATMEGNVIYIIYVDELEILTVLMYHCATYNVWRSLFSYCSVFGPYCKIFGHPCSIVYLIRYVTFVVCFFMEVGSQCFVLLIQIDEMNDFLDFLSCGERKGYPS